MSVLTQDGWKPKNSDQKCVSVDKMCASSLIIVLLHAATLENIWFDTFCCWCVCTCLSVTRPVGKMMERRIHLVSVYAWNESKLASLPEKIVCISLAGWHHSTIGFFNQDSPRWKFHGKGNCVCFFPAQLPVQWFQLPQHNIWGLDQPALFLLFRFRYQKVSRCTGQTTRPK